MKLYAETSAVLAWLLGEPSGAEPGKLLGMAETVTSSDLTMIESRRAIHRGVASGILTESNAEGLERDLNELVGHWMISRINQEVVVRASGSFPVEPIRTLDAIHLATAVRTLSAISGLSILTLDHRVRENARAMGIGVVPE
jgi:hypothetical protein